MNKKGFVLTETLMVAVFIITIFTFIYTSLIPLLGTYKDKSTRDEDIDIAYKLHHIRTMIKKDINADMVTSDNVKVITCNDLSDRNYCNNLMSYLDLDQYTLVYTKSIKNNLNSIKNINNEISKYIDNYRNEDNESLILLNRNDHTIVHLNYSTINIMGDIPSNILDYKSDIIEVRFKKEDTLTINEKYRNIDSNMKANVTYEDNGRVLAWLEEDPNDNTKYILYIESNDVIYLRDGFNFSEYSSVTTIDLGNATTSKMTNMSRMFYNCSELTNLILGSFNTANVTDMSYMFYECEKLPSLTLSTNFNTSKVTNMTYMFYGCKALASLNFSNNFKTVLVTDMSYMFSNCKAINRLELPGNFVLRNVLSTSHMFDNCTNLEILKLPSAFKSTNQVTDMSYMFANCLKMSLLTVAGCDGIDIYTNKVTNMSYMFYYCRLTNLTLGRSFDTSNVTDMSYMFAYNAGGGRIELGSNFNTSNVTNMSHMFDHSNVQNLQLPAAFDTSNVTDMSYMFYNCSDIDAIVVYNSFALKEGLVSTRMFHGCRGLRGGNNTQYNISNVDATYARIDTASTPGYFRQAT